MMVNYPANADDEEFIVGGSFADSTSDAQPTSMAFFLHRIKLAQLCRESMDRLQSVKKCPLQTVYQLVLGISERYMSFLNELPWFLRLDEETPTKHAELATQRPYITRQRAVLLYGLYSRLGRLHRPFVSRGFTDPHYATSHQIGIECAEKLLQIRRMTAVGNICAFGGSHSVDQHSFNAMLLLTIDVMARPQLEISHRRRRDIIEMCHLLRDDHMRVGRPRDGISRAVGLLLEIVQSPHKMKPLGPFQDRPTSSVVRISLSCL
ncbi:uncharacterized protein N7482_009368 [Penicillium canariense]|uniref:Uncharacterized protein n=1 Tax=Penicillium canariense TaxID=189055 RepID=A0A9W9HQQ0_9EURO|nr:uncharacterized protein N7482_009368 [Penicillium canariense]KAJ5152890.1 hypothetical protein N7482_009368 [Penicillium canariense]